MYKGFVGLAVAFVSGMVMAAEEPLPLPKEGSGTGVTIGSVTLKVLPLGKDRMQMAWEFLGAGLADDAKGLSHNTSVRCVGGGQYANGVPETYTNSCVATRPDGDQYFLTEKVTSSSGPAAKGGVTQGTSAITGGTGKLAGITGTVEWTRYGVRPALEGTVQTVTRGKITYKLP
jgi:hypothetical protein